MEKVKLLPLIANSIVALAAASGIYLNAEAVSAFLPDFLGTFAQTSGVSAESENTNLVGLILLIIGTVLPSGAYGWFRRIRTTGRVELGKYFETPEYTNLPAGRMGYSDRVSYSLAELSDLAYWDVFEEAELDGLKALAGIENTKSLDIKELAKSLLASNKRTTQEKFDAALAQGGFKPIERSIRAGETQCFTCVHEGFGDEADHQPYIVVAFRGSEQKVEDWLTNADAIPASEFMSGPVHQGFYAAYKSVQQHVLNSIRTAQAQYGDETPVFFTGHSLGGALAVIATRLNAPNIVGGCYTYGAPRVGGYAFFKGLKTPVYRVVNSSDLVPKVPPGVWSYLLIGLLSLLSFLTARWEAVSTFFDSAKGFIDKINDYRHHGDLRFLPDMPSAKIDGVSKHVRELQVLSNPNQFDMIQWFYRHLLVSFGMPVKSHSMKLYRNKLLRIATNRMEPFDVGEQQI